MYKKTGFILSVIPILCSSTCFSFSITLKDIIADRIQWSYLVTAWIINGERLISTSHQNSLFNRTAGICENRILKLYRENTDTSDIGRILDWIAVVIYLTGGNGKISVNTLVNRQFDFFEAYQRLRKSRLSDCQRRPYPATDSVLSLLSLSPERYPAQGTGTGAKPKTGRSAYLLHRPNRQRSASTPKRALETVGESQL